MKKHKLLNEEEQCPICKKFTLENSITRYYEESDSWETFSYDKLDKVSGEEYIYCYYCSNCGAIFERED